MKTLRVGALLFCIIIYSVMATSVITGYPVINAPTGYKYIMLFGFIYIVIRMLLDLIDMFI